MPNHLPIATQGGASAIPTAANNTGGGSGWGDSGFIKGGGGEHRKESVSLILVLFAFDTAGNISAKTFNFVGRMGVVFLEITRLRSINRGVRRGLRGRLLTLLIREFFCCADQGILLDTAEEKYLLTLRRVHGQGR